MGYNKENFKRIRAEYETKTFAAQEEADVRRNELYTAIPELYEMDRRLAQFGLRIMKAALAAEIPRKKLPNCAPKMSALHANVPRFWQVAVILPITVNPNTSAQLVTTPVM